jgi:putative inorganic carbon (HCO3(-)) transporter
VPFRDIVITLIVLGSLPVCLARPWVGIVMWFWIGYMNPHRLTWSFAYAMPFAEWIAITTLAGFLLTRDRKPLPWTRETVLLSLLWVLFTLSTINAMYPHLAWPHWQGVSKVFLFSYLAMMLCQTRERLRYLVLTIALSLGFYAVKGAFFVARTGGAHQVEYPGGTSMGGNTGVGLALVMALPMFVFLAREEQGPWLRRALRLMTICAFPSIAFSYSRGAVVGLGAVALLLLLKANRKVLTVVALAAVVIVIANFAPVQWFQRMDTLRTYEQDKSAQMRFESWFVFYRVGLDYPLLGAGFWGPSEDELYMEYVRNPLRAQNAHNSPLNVLGEHGIPALLIWVGLILSCVLTLRSIRKRRGSYTPPSWVRNYSHMFELTFVGYAVTGFFLSAAYLEFFYNLVALTVILKVLARQERELARRGVERDSTALAPAPTAALKPRGIHVRHFRPA